jgi:hypothetical protein
VESAVIRYTPNVSLVSEALSGRIVSRDIEPLVSQNFFDKYLNMILLPDCHQQFYQGWSSEIRQLMSQHHSLYYSILACSAAQVYRLDGIAPLRELTLEYYDRGIKGVSKLLTIPGIVHDNALLTSIIMLYLHGCLGYATFSDIPRHLDATSEIIRKRFLESGLPLQCAFDRIAVESCLCQIFLMGMGSWAHPEEVYYRFDVDFWLQAERLLDSSDMFPFDSVAVNSPIIAVPLSLHRLLLTIRQMYWRPREQSPETIAAVQAEVEEWEIVVLREGGTEDVVLYGDVAHFQLYRDAFHLYILIASLLMEQFVDALDQRPYVLQPQGTASWQVRKVTQILESHVSDDLWSNCYITNWSCYTVGFFMQDSADIELVRSDLLRRRRATGTSQLQRFSEELESVWLARSIARSADEFMSIGSWDE